MPGIPPLVRISEVEVLADHELRLTFEDGIVGDVSFEEAEWRGVLAPLRDAKEFARVSVDREIGTLVWPGGQDMAPEPLYREALQRRVAASAAR